MLGHRGDERVGNVPMLWGVKPLGTIHRRLPSLFICITTRRETICRWRSRPLWALSLNEGCPARSCCRRSEDDEYRIGQDGHSAYLLSRKREARVWDDECCHGFPNPRRRTHHTIVA